MKSIPAICIALVLSAVAGEAPQAFEITLDLGADFVRDLRESTAAPVLGYAGSMIEYPDSMLQWLFVTNRAETIGDDSGALRLSDGVIYGDAVLASPTLASTNLIVGTTAKNQSLAGIPVLHYDVGRIAEVLAFDVHPRSKAGRWTAAGYVTDNEWSPPSTRATRRMPSAASRSPMAPTSTSAASAAPARPRSPSASA